MFEKIIKYAQEELADNEIDKHKSYVSSALTGIFTYIEKRIKEQPELSIDEAIQEIHKTIQDVLQSLPYSSIISASTEYYMTKNLSIDKLNKVYSEVNKQIKNGEIDLKSENAKKLKYGYNLDENLRKYIIKKLAFIRAAKEHMMYKNDYIAKQYKVISTLTNKEFNKILKVIEHPEEVKYMRMVLTQDEQQVLYNMLDKANKLSRHVIEKECIQQIVQCVNLLDKIGLMEEFTNSNNKMYKDMYIHGLSYSYEEVMKLLSEKELKKLNIEKLILLSSSWTNRITKKIKDINTAMYLVYHPELIESKESDEGNVLIHVKHEIMQATELKTKVIHKLLFKLFEDIEEKYTENGVVVNKNELEKNSDNKEKIEDIKNEKNNINKGNNINEENLDNINDEEITDDKKQKDLKTNLQNYIDIDNELQVLTKKYGKKYKKFFDELFPDSKNSLEEDLDFGLLYENTIYNSYRIKDATMKVILISLLNNAKKIENFGIIIEDETQNPDKKYILLGIDMKGLNMPYRSHMNIQDILEILKGAQNGNTLFSVYNSAEDFIKTGKKPFSTHILVPVPKEKELKLKQICSKLTKQDRYGKAIKHLYYIASDTEMPEHMKKHAKKTYIDLEAYKKEKNER